MNTPNATLFVGLPGSGKTHAGNALSKATQTPFLDDYNDPSFFELIQLAKNGKDVIISDPYFCLTKTRESAIKRIENMGFSVFICYFENEPDKCRINAGNRSDGRSVSNFIKYLSQEYEITDEKKSLRMKCYSSK